MPLGISSDRSRALGRWNARWWGTCLRRTRLQGDGFVLEFWSVREGGLPPLQDGLSSTCINSCYSVSHVSRDDVRVTHFPTVCELTSGPTLLSLMAILIDWFFGGFFSRIYVRWKFHSRSRMSCWAALNTIGIVVTGGGDAGKRRVERDPAILVALVQVSGD